MFGGFRLVFTILTVVFLQRILIWLVICDVILLFLDLIWSLIVMVYLLVFFIIIINLDGSLAIVIIVLVLAYQYQILTAVWSHLIVDLVLIESFYWEWIRVFYDSRITTFWNWWQWPRVHGSLATVIVVEDLCTIDIQVLPYYLLLLLPPHECAFLLLLLQTVDELPDRVHLVMVPV